GEKIAPAAFEGLRSVSTALLAGFDLGVPLVAAVNGHARGGGLDLLLAGENRVGGAPGGIPARGGGAGGGSAGEPDGAPPRAPDRLGARAGALAGRAADRGGARGGDRVPEPGDSQGVIAGDGLRARRRHRRECPAGGARHAARRARAAGAPARGGLPAPGGAR